jgi:hypothetical protein
VSDLTLARDRATRSKGDADADATAKSLGIPGESHENCSAVGH